MKTEKRLTMALSVLVALMMLAVPLASSSNLFVDGGQTNSNGDAPSLGAASYRVDFILNEGSEGRISLDKVADIDLSALNGKFTDANDKAVFYQDEDGNLFAVVTGEVTIQQLIWALTSSPGNDATFSITKDGYILDSFVNNDSKAAFGPDKNTANVSEMPKTADGDKITKNMTLTATWLLDDSKYAEIPVDVVYNDETKEYVKAYAYDKTSNNKKVIIPANNYLITNGIDKLDTYGIIVNAKGAAVGAKVAPAIEKVYSFKATYGSDNKEFEYENNKNKAVNISADSKITIKYTFNNDKYSEIVVSSIAFKDGKDVTLYADKIRSYTYSQVYAALTTAFDKLSHPDEMTKSPIGDLPILDASEKDGKFITADGYELTGWNEGAQLVKSENNASSPLTLDAKLNGYYVLFMSKGQYEYVYVPFGELSADKTTLDIAGVNHWVYIKYADYKNLTSNSAFKPFNFASTADVDEVEKVNESDSKEPAAVLIACFTPTSSTSYAVFDANSYTYLNGDTKPTEDSVTEADINNDLTLKGTFGNEYVQYLIIPGKVGDKISVPSVEPTYGEDLKVVFISWNHFPAVIGENTITVDNATKYLPVETSYNEKDKYSTNTSVYSANAVTYEHKITFYDGDKVIGTFYYTTAPTTKITSGLAAFEVNGKAYETAFDDEGNLKLSDAAQKAYNSILVPDKAGYYITQWNDADKNKVIEFKWKDEKLDDIKTDVKDMKDDLNLYAQFKAEKYDIEYTNTYGNVGSMTQAASVDETVKLYSDSTFVYNGYKLTGWSDRPDGEGNKYDLGASFTLNGEQFEDLKDGKFTLYAVWESTGSVTPGGNTGGDDNNNTDTYLLAGILAVIIILIILIAFLMKRKN